MTRLRTIISARIQQLRCDEAGAALVEFALVLPLMIIFFGATVEGARMVQAFQSANAGVRDASRYLARIAPADVCANAAFIKSFEGELETMIDNKVTNGTSGSIEVGPVEIDLDCELSAPIATVTATLRVAFPLGGLLELGGAGFTELTTTISDQARIYGR